MKLGIVPSVSVEPLYMFGAAMMLLSIIEKFPQDRVDENESNRPKGKEGNISYSEVL